jgi:hypothetical protein
MSSKKFNKYNRKGAVLPLMMLIVLLMMLIGFSVTGLGMYSRLLSIRTASNTTARCAADSGISDAVFEMNKKLKVTPWSDSTLPAKLDVLLQDTNATFSYVVSKNNNVYSVHGTGEAGGSIHTIDSKLRLTSPFDYALLTRKKLELKNAAKIDWYHNKAGDWPAKIGTCSISEGAVLLMNGSTINGDVMVGVNGDPDKVVTNKAGTTITGDTYSLTSEPELPAVVVPDSIEMDALKKKIDASITISASGKYAEINLGTNAKLTIDEPVTLYVTGKVTMGNGSQIVIGGAGDIDNDASLTLYIAGDISAANSMGFNNSTEDAKRLKIFCLPTCNNIVLKNKTDFYGALYAPSADVIFDNGANAYGSLVADNLTIKNSGTFFYDANLRNRSIYDELVRFTIDRWSEE